MDEVEEKVKKIIESLSKDELIELRKQILDIFKRTSYYIPSGDSVVIANYARNFHYDEKRKEEVLNKLK